MKPGHEIALVPARPEDAEILSDLVCELAEYEQLRHAVVSTAADLQVALEDGLVEAVLAFDDGKPAGFALFYMTFSSFSGRPGLYIEDLFVCSEYRRRGIGRDLFTWLGNRALHRNCDRMSWLVLNWNEPARGFYERLGARENRSWLSYVIDETSLKTLSETASRETP